ncbi:hypothetical protein ACQY0O_005199 [Thecaphora frezii]
MLRSPINPFLAAPSLPHPSSPTHTHSLSPSHSFTLLHTPSHPRSPYHTPALAVPHTPHLTLSSQTPNFDPCWFKMKFPSPKFGFLFAAVALATVVSAAPIPSPGNSPYPDSANGNGGNSGDGSSSKYPTTWGNSGDKGKGGSNLDDLHSQQPKWDQGSGTTDDNNGQNPSKVYRDELSYAKENGEDGNNSDNGGKGYAYPEDAEKYLALYNQGYPIDQTGYVIANGEWNVYFAGQWLPLENPPTGQIKTLKEAEKMLTDDDIEGNQANSNSNTDGSTYGQDGESSNLQEDHRNANSGDDDDDEKHGLGGKYRTDDGENNGATKYYGNGSNNKNKDIAGDFAKANGGSARGNEADGSQAKTGNPETSQKTIANRKSPFGGSSAGSTGSASNGSTGSVGNSVGGGNSGGHPTNP